MPVPAPIPPQLAAHPFTREEGLSRVSPDDLRGPSYERLLRGVYRVAGEPVDHGARIRAARRILPPQAILAGASAMWALGVPLADSTDPVEVILPPGRRLRNRAELTIRNQVLPPEEMRMTPFGLATTPARTGFDLARHAEAAAGVPLLDALARETGVTTAQILTVARRHPRVPGASRAQYHLSLVDPGAESVRESLLRLVLVSAGLPKPATQVRILTPEGHFVARVDLGWPQWRVAVEYDGAHHDQPGQIARDRRRINAIRVAGWTPIVVDRAQLARRDDLVALVRNVLRGAGAPL